MQSTGLDIERTKAGRPSAAARRGARTIPGLDAEPLEYGEFRMHILSVPVIFIALIKRLGLPFAVYPNRQNPDVWCFKFQRRFVLELDGTGRASWNGVEPAFRYRIEATLRQAVELHTLRRRSRPRRRAVVA